MGQKKQFHSRVVFLFLLEITIFSLWQKAEGIDLTMVSGRQSSEYTSVGKPALETSGLGPISLLKETTNPNSLCLGKTMIISNTSISSPLCVLFRYSPKAPESTQVPTTYRAVDAPTSKGECFAASKWPQKEERRESST